MFLTAIVQKVEILAKDQLTKVDLEGLADAMEDNQYAVFTKTREIAFDKSLHQDQLGLERPTGLKKKDVYNLSLEQVKKAKYAHLVTLSAKKILTSSDLVPVPQAYKIFKKLGGFGFIKTLKDFEAWISNPMNFQLHLLDPSTKEINLFRIFTALHASEKIESFGYDAFDYYGKMILLSPSSYRVKTVFQLDLPKEKRIDTSLTEEEKDLLEKYAPDLGEHTSYRVVMSTDNLAETVHKMSDDDLAWHLLNSKNAMKIGDEDYVRHRFGFREICLLQLMNKKISKKERTELAEYMLDKAGVSFVGGPLLKKYLSALAKIGQIDSKILKGTEKDSLGSDIYYGEISDPEELRKIDYKEYGHQLAKNPHTPPDVLEKIAKHRTKKSEEVQWTGRNPEYGGVAGVDCKYDFSSVMQNDNFPLDKVLEVFHRYLKKYNNNYKAVDGMVRTLWSRKDLPKDLAYTLVKEVKKYSDLPSCPPYCFDAQEFIDYWQSLPKKNRDCSYTLLNHPHVPSEILHRILKEKDVYSNYKTDAFNLLKERGELQDDEVIKKVKKDLNFEGPDELLKHFGLTTFLSKKAKEKVTFKPVSAGEVKSIQKEMDASTVHDDFTFEVVAVYKIDQQVHKDYAKFEKKLGNVKKGLYHGTSMTNAAGILATGIDTDADSRTGQMFGAGFYLAASAAKAAQYASDKFSKSGYGIVFKMDVALGKSASWKYGRPERDNFYSMQDAKDREKIQDYAKSKGLKPSNVPRWHLDHDSVHAKKGLALQHDEFVVKSGQQINITEIIVIHKEAKK